MFEECQRYFKDDLMDPVMDARLFYARDKFALVIDLRTVGYKLVVSGKKIRQTQSRIPLEISKKATTENVNCHIFVLSDGLVNITENQLESVDY